jgi:hypothetical protein
MGLYADRVLVPDIFTSFALLSKTAARRNPEGFYVALFKELSVLRELLPLVNAGVIRFGTPTHAFCPVCRVEEDERFTKAVESLADAACTVGLEAYTVRAKRQAYEVDVSSPLRLKSGKGFGRFDYRG